VTVTALVVLLGCGTPKPSPPPAAHETTPYLIKAGDYLDIRFYKTPELNLEVPVRPDGQISLELIGDVQAAGLQPAELASSLRQRYASELQNPRVSVIIRAFGGQVFVQGEVKTPSAPPFAQGITALQAISLAGGFLDTAQPNSVILIRREDGQYHGYRLALNDAISGKDLAQDVSLMPLDILHVPRSRIANVDLFVDQYFRKVLPVQPAVPLF
jgi:protein involved in polysaccharide export with SLBB domain